MGREELRLPANRFIFRKIAFSQRGRVTPRYPIRTDPRVGCPCCSRVQHAAADHLAVPLGPHRILEVRQRPGARDLGLQAAFLQPWLLDADLCDKNDDGAAVLQPVFEDLVDETVPRFY